MIDGAYQRAALQTIPQGFGRGVRYGIAAACPDNIGYVLVERSESCLLKEQSGKATDDETIPFHTDFHVSNARQLRRSMIECD
ncbi:hypothetical protein [Luteibacter rhizovicinus]|uniref:hypothetical protein n=1 Tax=Luteibacter rhizovicinus TaxID=242606 RepID=UPI001051D010|nr:hypothetical protein [Luteibacter rhizovicinus]